MVIKITEISSICSKKLSDELLEKAALWEAFCSVRSDFQWLLPFFWSKETNEPSSFAYGLVLGYKYFRGAEAIRCALSSSAMLSTANALRNSQELGGHPVQERTLLVILRLANGTAYEDVFLDEKESAIFELKEYKCLLSEGRKQAVERAKGRVRRAKNLLGGVAIKVEHLSPQAKSFRELLKEANRRLKVQ